MSTTETAMRLSNIRTALVARIITPESAMERLIAAYESGHRYEERPELPLKDQDNAATFAERPPRHDADFGA